MKLHRHCLLFLCVFFMKGHDHVFAAYCGHILNISRVQTIQARSSFEFDYRQNQDVLIEYALLSEDDDNDDECMQARKKTWVHGSSVVNTISFVSGLFHSFLYNRRLVERFYYHSHQRYIFQRVLRV